MLNKAPIASGKSSLTKSSATNVNFSVKTQPQKQSQAQATRPTPEQHLLFRNSLQCSEVEAGIKRRIHHEGIVDTARGKLFFKNKRGRKTVEDIGQVDPASGFADLFSVARTHGTPHDLGEATVQWCLPSFEPVPHPWARSRFLTTHTKPT